MTGTAINPTRPAVLQVLPRLDTDEDGRAVLDLARHLRRRGWRSLVASAGGTLERELAAAGATHLRLPSLERDGWLPRWRSGAALARALRAHRVDLVHAQAPGPAWSAMRAARRAGAAFVVTCAELRPGQGKPARGTWPVIAAAQRVIAVSDFLGESLTANGGLDAARLRVVRRWIDPDEFDPERVRGHRLAAVAERCGVVPGPKLVVVPARLDPGQGHLLLIEALALLGRADFRVLFAGGGDPKAAHVRAVQERLRATRLSGRVHFGGEVTDLPAVLALADVVVLPAVRPDPSAARAAAAQAMGKPVIVTDQGALAEAVMPAATGWLVPPGNPGELARALDLALSLDEPVRARLAARARAFVVATFGMDALCERTLDVYRELLRPAAQGHPAPARSAASAVG
jgi:glycosyltransferase involved in cell wall biosynthesis